jgi:hypothetical protein
MAEQVIIEFISDVSQLAPAVDQLEKMGKVEKSTADHFKSTNTEVLKHVKTLEAVNATMGKIGQSGVPLKKTLVDLGTQVKGLSKSFMKDFQQGAKDALHAAGVSAEGFENALNGVTQESTSLKAQLREMVAALAQMKVSGQDNTAEYKALAQQAGQLKDAIADANQEVKNFGSDTSTLDGVISLAGGIAGGFAAVQGAAALFGDESEELQKTLLRVNAAMAILQGLQQLQVVLQKESAAATLANTIATKAQIGVQTLFNFVVGTSTGLLKAFRIALAATGVGLLVIGIIALVDALKSSNEELEKANLLLEQQKNLVDAYNEGVQQGVEIEEARAEAAGKAQSEIIRIQGRGLQAQRKTLIESNQLLSEQQRLLSNTSEEYGKLNAQILENTAAINSIDNQILIKRINLEKQLADEQAEALKKRQDAAKKAAEDAEKLARERRAAAFEDFKAGIELQLLAAKEGSEEQLELRKSLLRAELQIDLDNEKLTLNQRKLLIQKFFKDRIDAEKKFVGDRERIILENIASDIQAELQGLEVSNERKLELTETAINLAAELELNAAVGNGAKIAEINAKRDKSIRDARIASIQAIAEYEIQLATATNGPDQRRLQAVQDNEKEILQVRLSAVDELVRINSNGVQKRIEALNKERISGLISQKDYNLAYALLTDEQVKILEDAENKKKGIIKSTTELAKQQAIELTQTILDATSEVIGVLDSLFQLQAAKENASLEERKSRLQELREAGAITEKEAIVRQKRFEADERRIKQQQAQREKTVAVFNAAIAIPQAVLKGLTTGGPILAAIYGALAAAQLAIVASRPLPKFGKGKKNKYEGFGEVGETGTELIQSGGKMYVADKRQVVWLGKDDKVFNPQETIQMLSGSPVNTERIMPAATTSKGLKIDYDKFGKAVAKHVSTNVYVDGVHEQQIKQQQFTEWQTKRRSWG